MAEKKKYRPGQADAETFRALPERAQELWFQYCEMAFIHDRYIDLTFISSIGIDYSRCNSPIEIIFNFAYDLVVFSEGYIGLVLEPQYEIKTGDKKYYLDFAFIADEVEGMISVKNPNYKLAIECDGHDFHERTKEQVAHDNEREYDLKMQGFDVLRFSGSQIYNHPFRCAAQTLEYILKKIGESNDGELSETTPLDA